MLVCCGVAFLSFAFGSKNALAAAWALIAGIWVANTWVMWSNSEYWKKKYHNLVDLTNQRLEKERKKPNGGYSD